MDHWVFLWRQLWLPSSPIGPAVTSTQASDQFKGYSADTCRPSAEVQLRGCTANRPADRGESPRLLEMPFQYARLRPAS